MREASFLKKHTLNKESNPNKRKLAHKSQHQPSRPPCPECKTQRVWKDGFRRTRHGDVQRWLCRNCGYRFTQKRGEILPKPLQKPSRWSINTASTLVSNRQVCEILAGDSKNLTKVETRTQKRAAGATRLTEADIRGKIVEFMWKLDREGYAKATVSNYGYILKTLTKKSADLFDPDSVKDVIARHKTWSQATKNNVVKAYNLFTKIYGIKWSQPRYKPVPKLPFIPTEKEIDDLIAGCSRQMATFLQLLKETAMRSGEAYNLQWTDIDTVNNTVRVTPEKGSNPRIFKISNRLMSMLNNLPKTSDKPFTYKNKFYVGKTFRKQRKRLAHKLRNPRILGIHFHTLRHWKATIEYHRTKDILHVMQFLGHKNIKNTLKYTQLVNFESDEYSCKVAKTVKEASQLIEAGFEYVTEIDGKRLFKKRK